jgi:hypothetical protein
MPTPFFSIFGFEVLFQNPILLFKKKKQKKKSIGLCGNVQKAKPIFNFFWPIIGPILALWYS